jgi:hypothetical protein
VEAKEAATRRRASFGSAGSYGVGDASSRWLEKRGPGSREMWSCQSHVRVNSRLDSAWAWEAKVGSLNVSWIHTLRCDLRLRVRCLR